VSTQKHYDIVIVGGGMVGSALACALGDSDLTIALIEGREPLLQWPEDSMDLRVSAISRGSQNFFARLGVWQAMCDMRVSPFTEMHVWDAAGTGSIHFDSAEIGEPNLGHIIENRVITKALFTRAGDFHNIDIFCPSTPGRLQLDNHGAQLELADGTILRSELLVGADGGRSWVREQANIGVKLSDYRHTAVVANVTTELPHQHTAWQRFLPTGPLALLPMSDPHICSIVWSTSDDEAVRQCELDETAFNTELEKAFEKKLGAVVHSGPRARFPIKGRHATHYVKPHLALIGDAAHTIHPLAGQGVNLGFADARCLAETLLAALAAQQPIGSFKTLRRYERARRGENLLMLEAMGLFKQLFSNNLPGLCVLRNTGLALTDRLSPIKRLFMDKALN